MSNIDARARDLFEKIGDAIYGVSRHIGPPGDYGYSTPQGMALKELYDLFGKIGDYLHEVEAAQEGDR